jgi:hypothetical protein
MAPSKFAGSAFMWGKSTTKKTDVQGVCDEIFAQLDHMAERSKKRSSAFRTGIYLDLAAVASIKQTLDTNASLKRAALLSIAKARGWREVRVTSKRFRLTAELVAISIGARNRKHRQLASRRGQAIDILLEDGIPPKKFSREIKRRGGILKIVLERRRPPKKSAVESNMQVVCEFSPADYEKLAAASKNHHISLVARKIAKQRLEVLSFNALVSPSLTEDQQGDWD